MLILFLVLGSLLGGLLSEMAASSAAIAGISPYLVRTVTVFEMSPININLYVLRMVLGFSLHFNLCSLAGMIVGLLLYRIF